MDVAPHPAGATSKTGGELPGVSHHEKLNKKPGQNEYPLKTQNSKPGKQDQILEGSGGLNVN